MVQKTVLRLAMTALAAAILLLGLPGDAQAKEGPAYGASKGAKMTRKFMRGVGNIAFGWAEVPKNIFRKTYSTDPMTGIIVGSYEGVKNGAKRMGIGVWETVTFFAPLRRNYRPYIEPEFVLMDEVDK